MAGIPPTYPLKFVAGDTVNFKFQILDDDLDTPLVPPAPRDLTGWSALSQVRKTSDSTVVEAEWTIAALGNDGYIDMELSSLQTQPWGTVKSLVSDVQLTDPSGEIETILKLKLQVSQDVSRE